MGDGPWHALVAQRTQMEKDQDWYLAHAASAGELKTFADNGHIFDVRREPPPSVLGKAFTNSQRSLLASASTAELRASLPTLKIRPAERNPVTGCLPHEVVDTRDFRSTTHSVHRRILVGQPKMAGREMRSGEIDVATGKVVYKPQQHYGTAEAMGMVRKSYLRPSTAGATSSSASRLSRTPSMAELDALLARRSRTRGRGGECAWWVENVRFKGWPALKDGGSGSSFSVMRPK